MAEKPPICAADRASNACGDVAISSCAFCEADAAPAAHREPPLLLHTVARFDAFENEVDQALEVA
jgi:hypothetical protein